MFLLVGNGLFHLSNFLLPLLLRKLLGEKLLFHFGVNLLDGHLLTVIMYFGIKDGFHIAYSALENSNAFQQTDVNFFLNGTCNDEVVDIHNRTLLSETVNTTDTLFHHHGIPWQIVVDHGVAELHIKTFTTHLGRQ